MIEPEKLINILTASLDYVDPRLISHGKRVSYLVYKILVKQNKYDTKELRDICLAVLLHDIGAYKTEEINKMVSFETVNYWVT